MPVVSTLTLHLHRAFARGLAPGNIRGDPRNTAPGPLRARNDVAFEDPTGVDHDRLGVALNKALYQLHAWHRSGTGRASLVQRPRAKVHRATSLHRTGVVGLEPQGSSAMNPRPIRKLLVANRGEIGIRVMRAAVEMDIKTVAIYSHEDRFALHRFKVEQTHPVGAECTPVRAYLADR